MKRSIFIAWHGGKIEAVEGTAHEITPEDGWSIIVHANKKRDTWDISDIPTGRKIVTASTRRRGLSMAAEILRNCGREKFEQAMASKKKLN